MKFKVQAGGSERLRRSERRGARERSESLEKGDDAFCDRRCGREPGRLDPDAAHEPGLSCIGLLAHHEIAKRLARPRQLGTHARVVWREPRALEIGQVALYGPRERLGLFGIDREARRLDRSGPAALPLFARRRLRWLQLAFC